MDAVGFAFHSVPFIVSLRGGRLAEDSPPKRKGAAGASSGRPGCSPTASALRRRPANHVRKDPQARRESVPALRRGVSPPTPPPLRAARPQPPPPPART